MFRKNANSPIFGVLANIFLRQDASSVIFFPQILQTLGQPKVLTEWCTTMHKKIFIVPKIFRLAPSQCNYVTFFSFPTLWIRPLFENAWATNQMLPWGWSMGPPQFTHEASGLNSQVAPCRCSTVRTLLKGDLLQLSATLVLNSLREMSAILVSG